MDKTFVTPKGDVPVDFHMQAGENELVALFGPGQCGKTTIINMIAGLEHVTKGEVYVNGTLVDKPGPERGVVFQNINLFPWLTTMGNVEYGLKMAGVPKAERRARAQKYIDLVGLQGFENSYPNQLSGGMKQRVGIARALTTDPELLLCDEATSALDPQTTESILKLLKRINREMGVTILLITHQMQVVQMICNKVAVMESGKIVESGSVLEVFGSPKMPVTKRFVQTVIRDQIPDSIVSLVKEQKENFRIERLKFIGSSVKRPVISDICKTDGVVVNILGAAVQELEDSVMCVFILQLIGDDESIRKAEEQIDKNGVLRERMEVE